MPPACSVDEQTALGITLAFIAIIIVHGPEAAIAASPGALRSDILMLLGALCAAIYSIFSRATLERLNAFKWDMLEEWSKTKKAPRHADWLHAKELRDT